MLTAVFLGLYTFKVRLFSFTLPLVKLRGPVSSDSDAFKDVYSVSV